MAITVAQGVKATGSLFGGTNTYTLTGLSALSAGQGIVVIVSNGNLRNVSSVVLSSSGTTTSLAALTNATLSGSIAMWHGIATGSETNANVVVTLSGNAGDAEMVGAIVASGWNASQTGAVGTNEASASATSHDIGALTPPTVHNLMVFGSSRGNRDWTDDADYTIVGADSNTLQIAYRIQSAANADTYNFSTGDAASAADMVYGAFAGAADGTTTRQYRLTMMGVS